MDAAGAQQTLNEALTALGDQKSDFLAKVEEKVSDRIRNSSLVKCLTVIERSNSGAILREHAPNPPDVDYVGALIAFCRGKRYNSHALDSGLTDPVVGEVTSAFESFYSKNQEIISRALLALLMENATFVRALKDCIEMAMGSTVPATIKQQVGHAVVARMSDMVGDRLGDTTIATVKLVTGKAVAVAVSSPIAAKLAVMLVHLLAVQLKVVLAKLLASAAFKAVIMAKVKAVVAGAVLVSVVHIVAAKLGIGTGAAFAIILLPIILAFLAYEAATFPRKLGEKVAVKIRGELSGQFESINRDIMTAIVETTIGMGTSMFAGQMMEQSGFGEALEKLAAELMNA
jgi:hypothetical protein